MRRTTEPTFKGWSAIEGYETLAQQILLRASRRLARREFLLGIGQLVLEFSGCDRVSIWIAHRPDRYHAAVSSSNGQRYLPESAPWDAEDPSEGGAHATLLDLRRRILQPGHPPIDRITARGSFWAADTRHVASLADLAASGSRSIAMIPICSEGTPVGLLELSSESADFFAGEEVRFYELVAGVIEIALAHRRSQLALRERVKELTCLYGIARTTAQPDPDDAEVVRSILELLPPAWLHPEIAAARIRIPAGTYATANYRDTPYRLRADVVLKGAVAGFVEVVYLEPSLDLDEGPFLAEERALLGAVARDVAGFLERRLAERETTQLQDQLRHADRLATIGQLAAGVAHEINEPLGNILGFAQLIQMNADLDEQTTSDLGQVVSACLNAREIIKKLMVFARQLPPRMEPIDLNEIARDGLYFFEARCAKAGIALSRTLDAELPPVLADSGQLNQVLVNLVVNAIQAMPDGGTLTVSTYRDGDRLVLAVEDTGIGMAEEIRGKIFVPFFTTKDVDEGTGLGLPVVYGIVRAHRGSIEVASEPGAGTRFEVSLPLNRPAEPEEDVPDALPCQE